MIDNIIKLSPPQKRDIGTSSSAKEKFAYKYQLDKSFEQHNIYSQIKHLFETATPDYTSESDILSILNKNDKLITRLMIKTDKNTTKRYYEHEYTIKLSHASTTIKFWAIKMRGDQGNRNVTIQL